MGYARARSNWIGGVNSTTPVRASDLNLWDAAILGLKQLTFNPLDYGAVGDGVTDDSAAIQAAINDAGSNNGCVLIPAKTFGVGHTLILKNGITVQGWGEKSIIQLLPNANCDVFSQGSLGTLSLDKVYLSNFLVDGNFAVNGGNLASYGFKIAAYESYFSKLVVRNCFFGLDTNQNIGPGQFSLMNVCERLKIYDCRHVGLSTSTDSMLLNSLVFGCGKDNAYNTYNSAGVYTTGWGNQYISNHFFNNKVQFYTNYCLGNQFRNNIIEAGNQEMFAITGRCANTVIANNILDNTNPGTQDTPANFAAIRIEPQTTSAESDSMSIIDNRFVGPNTYCVSVQGTVPITNLQIEGNHMSGGWSVKPVTVNLAGTYYSRNYGSGEDATGSASVTAGTSSVAVTHTLSRTPTKVRLTPTADTQGLRWWVSAKGATTFTITLNSNATVNPVTFDWRAEA